MKRGYPRNVGKLMPKVNEQAIQLYGFIVRYFAEREYIPSVREMCAFMDGRSESVVSYHLRVLEAWGWIKRTANVARGLRLTRPTERGMKPEQLRKMLGLEVVAVKSRKKRRSAAQRGWAFVGMKKPFSG